MKIIKSNKPFYFSGGVFLILLILWLFPNQFGFITETYGISQFRSDLKDLAGLFYIMITLWLVLVTRKMAETSINSQRALNRPEIVSELFISDEKPSNVVFNGIKNIEIRSIPNVEYIENLEGASVFILIKNRYGGGKAIDLKLSSEFYAKNPDIFKLERDLEIDFLAEGDAIALYINRFAKPSKENCELALLNFNLSYTNPFSSASNEPSKIIQYDKQKPILANGNLIGSINLADGIRTTV